MAQDRDEWRANEEAARISGWSSSYRVTITYQILAAQNFATLIASLVSAIESLNIQVLEHAGHVGAHR